MNDDNELMIQKYFQPKLDMAPEEFSRLTARLAERSVLQDFKKYQGLEMPGNAEHGRVWLSVNAMVHSYYYCESSRQNWGCQIWKKNELILFSSSLLENDYRYQHLQLLEPGKVLSFSYPDIRFLTEEFAVLKHHVMQVAIANQRAAEQRLINLNKPVPQRVKDFVSKNALFVAIASRDVQAMHNGLSRQWYESQLKNNSSISSGFAK